MGLKPVEVPKFFFFWWGGEGGGGLICNCLNCNYHCDNHIFIWNMYLLCHFISAVHIWFISYIVNTHFFHRDIWTHNWPAPNVNGFIAQLVEHSTGIVRSRVQTPLKSWIFFQASLHSWINCVHCDDLFIFMYLLCYYRWLGYFWDKWIWLWCCPMCSYHYCSSSSSTLASCGKIFLHK